MLMREQVVGKRGCVRQALQHGVEEARIVRVVEACSSFLPLLPVHANLPRGKEDPLWWSHSLGNDCREMMVLLHRSVSEKPSSLQEHPGQPAPTSKPEQGKPNTACDIYCLEKVWENSLFTSFFCWKSNKPTL